MEGQTGAKTDRAELKNYPPPPPPYVLVYCGQLKKHLCLEIMTTFFLVKEKHSFPSKIKRKTQLSERKPKCDSVKCHNSGQNEYKTVINTDT